jgi:hypothetical protein
MQLEPVFADMAIAMAGNRDTCGRDAGLENLPCAQATREQGGISNKAKDFIVHARGRRRRSGNPMIKQEPTSLRLHGFYRDCAFQ